MSRGFKGFLGHALFYCSFIKNFSKISQPLTRILIKDALFEFGEECLGALNSLKVKLIQAPILITTYWNLPFELKCDASDHVVGVVLGQEK